MKKVENYAHFSLNKFGYKDIPTVRILTSKKRNTQSGGGDFLLAEPRHFVFYFCFFIYAYTLFIHL
jgi:hypothetical protein